MTDATPPDRRLMLVHAHPDDESLITGATMAAYAAGGAAVTLVTCTLGELGEIVADDLAHLADAGPDALGQHRLGELGAAMAALGVTDAVRLGGDHRFRDSGMAWAPDGTATVADTTDERSFRAADLVEAADALVPLIRDRRPQVLITYDQFGGYGHPDHVKAHRVATYATALAAVPSYRPELGARWQIRRVLWSTLSSSQIARGVATLDACGLAGVLDGIPTDPSSPLLSRDEDIAVAVDGREQVAAKIAALRAYRSQLRPDLGFLTLPDDIAREFWGWEHYRFAGGEPLPAGGWAGDVFAGLG